MQPIYNFWAWFTKSSVRIVGLAAILLSIVFGLWGYHSLEDFLANASTELASIALTVLIIDALNENRATRELKARLIREMGSADRGTALRAIEELKAQGWLKDGSLHGAFLWRANLKEVWLDNANLQHVQLHLANLRKAHLKAADLREATLADTDLAEAELVAANLEGANLVGANLSASLLISANLCNARGLTDDQLAKAGQLRFAMMPDGSRYNGRFKLYGDIEEARALGFTEDDPEKMARYYDISVEQYLRDRS